MRWLFGILTALVVLVIAAALAAPSVIDLGTRKDALARLAGRVTGRALTIEGPVAFRLLPTPVVSLSGLRLASLPGMAEPDVIRIARLDARLSLLRLLVGEIEIENLDVGGAEINLARASDGQGNWTFAGANPAALGDAEVLGALTGGLPLSFRRLALDKGVLVLHGADGTVERLEDISAVVKADTPNGPFALDARAVLHGQALAITLSAGRQQAGQPVPFGLGLTLSGDAARLKFSGTATTSGTFGLEGKLSLVSADAGKAAAGLGHDLPKPLAGAFELETMLSASTSRMKLAGLSVRAGDIAVTGEIETTAGATDGAPAQVDARLAIGQIDLDALVEALGATPATTTAPPPAVGAEPVASTAAFTLPTGLDGRFVLDIGALGLKGGVVQQVALEASLAGGVMTLTKGSALLPGGSDARLTGQVRQTALGPRFDGTLDLASSNLRGLVAWLGVGGGFATGDRANGLHLTTRIGATAEVVQLADIDLQMDGSRLTGAAAVALRARPSFSIDASVDQIDLGSYLGGEGTGLPSLDRLADFDTNFRFKVGRMIWRESTISGVDADIALLRGTLNVNRLEVADLAGARLSGGGMVRDLGGRPVVDVNLLVDAADPLPVLRLAGLTPPAGARLGTGHLELNLAGATDSQVLRFQARLGDTTVLLNGNVTDLLGLARADLTIQAATPSLAGLARTAGLAFAPLADADHPLTLAGTVEGNLGDASLHLGVDMAGGRVELQGKVDLAAGLARGDLVVSAHAADGTIFLRGLGLDLRDPAPDRANGAAGDAFALDSAVTWDEGAITLAGFKSSFGTADLVLDARRVSGPRPRLEATLSAGELDLSRLPARGDSAGGPGARWSTLALPFDWLRTSDGVVTFAVRHLVWRGGELGDARGKASFADGTLVLGDTSAALWGGTLGLDASIAAGATPADAPTLILGTRLANADFAAAGLDRLLHVTGRFDARLNLTAKGASPAALVASLAGPVEVTARDGTLSGFDLGRVADDVDARVRPTEIVGLIARSLGAGATPYGALEANWTLDGGIARPGSFRAEIKRINSQMAATVDLQAWTLDAQGAFAIEGAVGAPPVGYLLSGSLDNPKLRLDGTGLSAWAAQLAADRAAAPATAAKPTLPQKPAKPAKPAAKPPLAKPQATPAPAP